MSQANRNVRKAPIKLSSLSLEVLREICKSCLKAGTHWRPVVEPIFERDQWFWLDRKETTRDRNGPFQTEQEALIAAARQAGVEREKAEALFGTLEEVINLRACRTDVLLAELHARGSLAALCGHIGGLYDELERADLIGKPGLDVLTYRAYCMRREESLLAGDATSKQVAARWQRRIDELGAKGGTAVTTA